MTYNFFKENYDLSQVEILDLKLQSNKLEMKINLDAHLDLIANGYRPELEISIIKTFIFTTLNVSALKIKKPYTIKYISNGFMVNNKEVIVCDNVVIKNN